MLRARPEGGEGEGAGVGAGEGAAAQAKAPALEPSLLRLQVCVMSLKAEPVAACAAAV